MALIKTYQRGETIPIWRTVKDDDGVLTTPDQGCELTLADPNDDAAVAIDTTDITATAMTEHSTGTFVYYFRSLVTDKKGIWNYSCKATNGTGVNAKYDIRKGAFNLT